jgi:hypothetical protein
MMSSALAMVLMAGMAVPGNDPNPEKVTGEVEQGLDLSGEWEGTSTDGIAMGEVRLVKDKGKATVHNPAVRAYGRFGFKVVDEGGGRLRILIGERESLGIYRYQDDDHVIICVSQHGLRPQSFCCGDGQELTILHRVKPRK